MDQVGVQQKLASKGNMKIKRKTSSYSFEGVIWFSVVFNNKFLALIGYDKKNSIHGAVTNSDIVDITRNQK